MKLGPLHEPKDPLIKTNRPASDVVVHGLTPVIEVVEVVDVVIVDAVVLDGVVVVVIVIDVVAVVDGIVEIVELKAGVVMVPSVDPTWGPFVVVDEVGAGLEVEDIDEVEIWVALVEEISLELKATSVVTDDRIPTRFRGALESW